MSTPTIIAAVPCRTDQSCAECGRPIGGPAVRVAFKIDRSVVAVTFHPHIDEDDEQRPCCPDHEKTRLAIRQLSSPRRAATVRAEAR